MVLARRHAHQTLLITACVVIAYVLLNGSYKLILLGELSEIIHLRLDNPPPPLHESVIQTSADPRHTLNHPGILFQLNLAASVAQSESESISENLKWSYKQKTAQGKFYANKNRYFGYDTKGDTFAINDDAECVRYIFDSYVNGMSVTEIADRLNKAGMKTGQGNDWTTSSVHCILKNEVYVGDVIFRKTPSRNIITGEIDEDWQPKYVRNHHVGIIDRETWDAAKARREANRRGVRAGTHACSGT